MVLVRMGLLDDAIREHLELKRRRGADPGEVAREQREALDVIGGEAAAEGCDSDDASLAVLPVSGAPLVDRPVAPGGEFAASELAQGEEAAEPVKAAEPSAPDTGAGETAELDMSSVLGTDADHGLPKAGPETSADGDSLEWEMPEDAAAREAEVEEPDEDVLEETPDFLRDTPEQERLWFEQRPPRDFDFDK
jgi:hypothetical protein